ncbi:hypothetical protein D3C81_1858610 [compost metagenome]
MGFVRGIGKFTGNLFDMTARHTGDLFAPGRGVGFNLTVITGREVIIKSAIEPVVRQD